VSFILNIDTAVQTASISLAKDGVSLATRLSTSQRDHAAWLQPAIAALVHDFDISLNHLDAISVSAGPGSYTGLRVGMATAKGICYALQKPLLLVSTLKMMAVSGISGKDELICPLIDARRMEVFTAVYDQQLNEIVAPHNQILAEESFKDILNQQSVLFFGTGSKKLRNTLQHTNATFKDIDSTAEHMAPLSYQKFLNKEHADLAYSEPFYGKEFYSPAFKSLTTA
jgi:tRNA threonylcarbamoyladenosine biosynthesis protein TsaB